VSGSTEVGRVASCGCCCRRRDLRAIEAA
jgi:hypothetical protein